MRPDPILINHQISGELDDTGKKVISKHFKYVITKCQIIIFEVEHYVKYLIK